MLSLTLRPVGPGVRQHLQRFAQPLRDILREFETDQEHEFVCSIGPTGSEQPLSPDTGDDE